VRRNRDAAPSGKPSPAGTAIPDPSAPHVQTPFERFEEFARKVVSVPKAEIEERERAYQERRRKDRG